MRRTIRLTESELRRMISESVKRVLKESADEDAVQNFINKVNFDELINRGQTHVGGYCTIDFMNHNKDKMSIHFIGNDGSIRERVVSTGNIKEDLLRAVASAYREYINGVTSNYTTVGGTRYGGPYAF